MFVKFQDVRNVAIVIGVVGVLIALGAVMFINLDEPKKPSAALPSTPQTATPAKAAPKSSSDSNTGSKQVPKATQKNTTDPKTAPAPLTDDARVIQRANTLTMPNTKLKDALRGHAWKVNLYEDTGDTQFDRAKIDQDRDDTWDEKWSFKGKRWHKDGASLVWSGSGWVPPDKVPRTKSFATRDEADGVVEHVAMARKILAERASGKKRKDVTEGSGAKYNFYDDDGDGAWDRAKVDQNRNGTWDEKWTIKNGVLERKIEATGKVFVFRNDTWAPK